MNEAAIARKPWPLDAAWIGLLAFTALMGFAATIEDNSVLLLAISCGKAVLISAIFMGLWRSDKRVLAAVLVFFVGLVAGLLVLLPG